MIMTGRQGIILIVAIAVTILLYNLPRSVVDNDASVSDIGSEVESAEVTHSFDLPDELKLQIATLQKLIINSEDKKNCAIFADSLAGIYLSYNNLDSAEVYADQILQFDSSSNGQVLAGELYFQLYGISLNQNRAKLFADKAAKCFEKALKEGDNPDLRAKLAMTKVVTSNPMEGIVMLRGVLEEYPENKTALYNMGMLSMQSGQYDKAVERFEKLMVVDNTNDQAAYYLAVSHFETGNLPQAKEWFEKIKLISGDPAILESADQYLTKLNEL